MAAIKIKTKDTTALPTALLTLAKEHMRVDGSYDDNFIKSVIARAIDWFERVTNVSVFASEYEWTPDAANFCNGQATFTESPVTDLTVKVGADDKTAEYSVTMLGTHGVGIYALNGSFADGLVATFKSGYADQNAMPPGVLDAVLRYAAHLYEHREILVPNAQMSTPGWMGDVIATYWMPRA